ncbi:iron-siderophore ABC transporter substrate-binding protein [Shinella zoogloeoides]|uniref:iron-siderophore ABC transporter substrate-binding protein n=1 Tax=Shinella zoogloeoides TaxID=352475 RepID=UPI0028A6B4BE|nr:iron-siderophore ABC transporter substrate-binding protein [Shinella zoogloeoides]
MSADRLPLPLLSRRALLRSASAAAFAGALPARAAAAPRVVSLDYGLATTLLSLGIVPLGIPELRDWDKWVVEPPLPAGVADLGSTFEVNFEVLAVLRPDIIITTPFLDMLLPRLRQLATVLRLEVFTPDGGPVLTAAAASTRRLAAAVGREAEAERFLSGADAFFEDCRRRLSPLSRPSVAFINFMDARHARIYGAPGLFHNVLERIGVRNAWTEPSNFWGFQTIAIEELSRITDPDAKLVAFEPIPADALPTLAQSPLWRSLPIAQPGHFFVLPPALMFGMVNEAMRFGRLVTQWLERGV